MNLFRRSRRAAWLVAGGGSIAAALLGAAALALPSDAEAQSYSCANATKTLTWEAGETFGYVDVGQGNVAAFVCITSSAYQGGASGAITANGGTAGGCYFIDGLGSSVVSVFKEDPAVKQCADPTMIAVGLASSATTTPTSTPTSTATATGTATQTATATPTTTATPTATATATGTATATATASKTAAPPTAAPSPPKTGTGLGAGEDGGVSWGVVAIALAGLGAAGVTTLVVARKHH